MAAEVVVEKASIDEVYLDVTPMVVRKGGGGCPEGCCCSQAGRAKLTLPLACHAESHLILAPQDAELASADEAMQDGDGTEAPSVFSWGSIVKGDTPLQPGSCFDRRFAVRPCRAPRACTRCQSSLGKGDFTAILVADDPPSPPLPANADWGVDLRPATGSRSLGAQVHHVRWGRLQQAPCQARIRHAQAKPTGSAAHSPQFPF